MFEIRWFEAARGAKRRLEYRVGYELVPGVPGEWSDWEAVPIVVEEYDTPPVDD